MIVGTGSRSGGGTSHPRFHRTLRRPLHPANIHAGGDRLCGAQGEPLRTLRRPIRRQGGRHEGHWNRLETRRDMARFRSGQSALGKAYAPVSRSGRPIRGSIGREKCLSILDSYRGTGDGSRDSGGLIGAPAEPRARPPQIADQRVARFPGEFPELTESNRFGVKSRVGFDPPAQVRTAPGPEPVAARHSPEQPQQVNIPFTSKSRLKGGCRQHYLDAPAGLLIWA